MLVPSLDRIVSLADLKICLCDGDAWKKSVKVCLELFSTATATKKLVGENERNNLHINNCSFGYIKFTLVSYISKRV